MNVKALIVGVGVLEVMSRSDRMTLDDYQHGEQIQRIGAFGDYPVYLDQSLPPDKLMVTYSLNPGESPPDESMVRRWRDVMPGLPDDSGWIPLVGQRDGWEFKPGDVDRRANRRAQRANQSSR